MIKNPPIIKLNLVNGKAEIRDAGHLGERILMKPRTRA